MTTHSDSDQFEYLQVPAGKLEEFLIERAVGAVTIRFGRLEFLASFLMQSIADESARNGRAATEDRASEVRKILMRVAGGDALISRDPVLARLFRESLDEWRVLNDRRNATIHAAFGVGPDGQPNTIDRRTMQVAGADERTLLELADSANDLMMRLGALGAHVQNTLRA